MNNNQTSTFLIKLHGIVSDKLTEDIIRWSIDGLQVIINDQDRLFSEVLPDHFELRSYLSFIR